MYIYVYFFGQGRSSSTLPCWSNSIPFRDRKDTFSLGVCNSCQLMALLGWVPFPSHIIRADSDDIAFDPSLQTRFIHNTSGRFESRWVAVKILDSPAVLLKGMADSTLGFRF